MRAATALAGGAALGALVVSCVLGLLILFSVLRLLVVPNALVSPPVAFHPLSRTATASIAALAPHLQRHASAAQLDLDLEILDYKRSPIFIDIEALSDAGAVLWRHQVNGAQLTPALGWWWPWIPRRVKLVVREFEVPRQLPVRFLLALAQAEDGPPRVGAAQIKVRGKRLWPWVDIYNNSLKLFTLSLIISWFVGSAGLSLLAAFSYVIFVWLRHAVNNQPRLVLPEQWTRRTV